MTSKQEKRVEHAEHLRFHPLFGYL